MPEVLYEHIFSVLFSICLQMELLGHMVIFIFNFLRKRTILYSHQQRLKVPVSLHPRQVLVSLGSPNGLFLQVPQHLPLGLELRMAPGSTHQLLFLALCTTAAARFVVSTLSWGLEAGQCLTIFTLRDSGAKLKTVCMCLLCCFHRLNVSPPSPLWKPHPQCDGIRRWGFWEFIRS